MLALIASLTSRRLNPTAIVGASVLVGMFALCVLTLPWTIANFDQQFLLIHHAPPHINTPPATDALPDAPPVSIEANGKKPNTTHAWIGTDGLGRSLLSRCLLGGVISLGIGLTAAAISVIIGTLWGLFSGYMGGRTDALMMRMVDVLYGLPYILLVLLMVVAIEGILSRIESSQIAAIAQAQAAGIEYTRPAWFRFIENNGWIVNLGSLLVAIGAVSWLTLARVVRGQVLSLKNQPFVEAARATGCGTWRILLRHLLPNLLGPIIVYTTLTVPQAILQESFLSFLGIGVKAPLPSWGNLAAEGLRELNPVRSHWWLLVFPCGLLGITLLSLNFLGDGLRDYYDPKSKR